MTLLKKNAIAIGCLALVPLTRLLQLYNANGTEILFSHTMIVAAVLGLVLLVEYAIARLVLKSHFSALFLCLLSCAVFFMEPFLWYSNIRILAGYHITRLWPGFVVMGLLFLLIAFIFIQIGKKVPQEVNTFFIVLVVFLVGINGVEAINSWKNANREDVQWKTDFSIDSTTESPNIYWFHMDGMMNFQTVENYYGLAPEPFETELAKRGFTNIPDVLLESNHATAISLTAYLSPSYYERILLPLLAKTSASYFPAQRYLSNNPLELFALFEQMEVFNSFSQKGYAIDVIGLHNSRYLLGPADRFYANPNHYNPQRDVLEAGHYPFLLQDINRMDYFRRDSFANLLTLLFDDSLARTSGSVLLPVTPIYTPVDTALPARMAEKMFFDNQKAMLYYSPMLQSLYDMLQTESQPRFMFMHNTMPHFAFAFNRKGATEYSDAFDVRNYPAHHAFAFDTLMNMVDMVLEQNPDAVIFLVADHGIHVMEAQVAELFGRESQQEIWNSVFYAVRIPEKWDDSPDMHALMDPRNAGRYLVNTFVGENYEYMVP